MLPLANKSHLLLCNSMLFWWHLPSRWFPQGPFGISPAQSCHMFHYFTSVPSNLSKGTKYRTSEGIMKKKHIIFMGFIGCLTLRFLLILFLGFL